MAINAADARRALRNQRRIDAWHLNGMAHLISSILLRGVRDARRALRASPNAGKRALQTRQQRNRAASI